MSGSPKKTLTFLRIIKDEIGFYSIAFNAA